MEDLWPFNEEVVARAIFASKIPVISAVGHETDFTIADFVADLRAPTPSAAAELAVPDIEDVKLKLLNYNNRLKIALKKKLELMRLQYEKCMSTRAFKEPMQLINEQYIKIDVIVNRIRTSGVTNLKIKQNQAYSAITKLDTLSPLKTLTRGYCVAQADRKIIRTVNDIKQDDIISLKFTDGDAKAKIL